MKNLARNNPSYCWALQKNVLTVTTKTMSYQELCKHMAEHNFKKISFEKRRSIMHVMYDAPFFLKAEELKRVMRTGGPAPRGFGRGVPIYEFGVVRPVFIAPSGL